VADDLHPIVSQWVTFLREAGKSDSTLKGYRRGLVRFTTWYRQSGGGPSDLSAVMPRDVRDWIAFQQTVEEARPATINHRRDIALFELLVGTGLRVSEALKLRVGDLSLNDRSGRVTVRRGKGGVHREVPLTKEVRQTLKAYLETHPDLEGKDPLWVGQRGPLKDPSAINRLLAKYARLARVKEVTPHALRHTFATRYLEAHPGDIRYLAAILGHADLKTTMVYTEPDLDDLARRMEEAEVGEQA
jgi:integrase/recombinase XerC